MGVGVGVGVAVGVGVGVGVGSRTTSFLVTVSRFPETSVTCTERVYVPVLSNVRENDTDPPGTAR